MCISQEICVKRLNGADIVLICRHNFFFHRITLFFITFLYIVQMRFWLKLSRKGLAATRTIKKKKNNATSFIYPVILSLFVFMCVTAFIKSCCMHCHNKFIALNENVKRNSASFIIHCMWLRCELQIGNTQQNIQYIQALVYN